MLLRSSRTSRGSRALAKSRRKSRRGLHLEGLEDRRLMAVGDELIHSDVAPFNPLAPQANTVDLLRAQELLRSFDRAANLDRYTADQLAATDAWVILTYGNLSEDALQSQLGAGELTPTGLIANTYHVAQPAGWDWKDMAGVLQHSTQVAYAYPLVTHEFAKKFIPNDTLFADQWHLQNTGQTGGTVGADANIVLAWDQYRGTNVVIGVVDDGLQRTHPDLVNKYLANLSYDFVDNDADPSPDVTQDHHGTAVAGVAAASTNNSTGVAGAAPNALLAGLRLLGANQDDVTEAGALSFQPQQIHIYNNSWGPPDGLGYYLDAPEPLTLAAFQQGITTGRGGKGSIYAWAGGNGLFAGDNSNYDGYANSRYTIAVAAINDMGQQAWYSENGANILISAYSSDDDPRPGITTTDIVGQEGYNTGDYDDTFGGTSSATPLVSGVIALMLQANPNLTWRDVQHILVRSAEKNHAADPGWVNNGAGLHVNHKYGFGAIDALAAVNLARTWTTVGAQVATTTNLITVNAAVADNNATGVTRTINVTQDITLEKVEIVFNATHAYPGDLEIILTAPSGVQSILAQAHVDNFVAPYDNWVFTTVRNWGESSRGNWTLTVRDRAAPDAGTWDNFQLNFFGTNGPAFTPTGGASGIVWNDLDADATRDAGEPGLGGITVYADLNNNNVLNANEPASVTQPNGSYTIANLTAGSYTIRQVPQSFYQQTFPAGGAGNTITVVGANTVNNVNFGNMALIGVGPYNLTNATGDGTVSVGVDGYGAFGGATGSDSNDADYDPVGPITTSGTTFESGIAIGFAGNTTRQFLTSGSIAGTSGLPNPQVTGTATQGTSNFTYQNLAVNLTQNLSPTFDSSNARSGSLLTQTYIFTNTSGTTLNFDVVRYIDGDLGFDGSISDGGGRIVANGNEVLFETDSATGNADATTFVGIYTQGGTVPVANRYEIDGFSGLKTRIAAGTALDNTITGDGADADQFIDLGNGYDVTLALRNVFSIAPGQSAVYVTTTIFGSGIPDSFVQPPPPPPPPPPPTIVSGTIYYDVDGDNVQGTDEPGLPGIMLFVDLDGNGSIGLGEPAVYTDENGDYQFVGLPEGDYDIRPVPTAGYEVLAPSSGVIHVTVVEEETLADQHFAFKAQFDYGDAPASYGTLKANGGPVHGIVPGYHLGATVDGETNGQPSTGADGDDATFQDDDDGVRFVGVILPGTSVPIEVIATQNGILAGNPVQGVLQGWIDFNGDGDFLDANERVVTNKVLKEGVNNFNIFIPGSAKVGTTYARFRLGLEPNLGPNGPSQAGEVEDISISVGLLAVTDAFTVIEESTNNVLNPLTNDILLGPGTLTITAVGSAAHGTVSIAPGNTSLIYTPVANFQGLDSFTYTISNGLGGTSTGVINVNVQNTNDPPTAAADAITIVQNQTNVLLNVLANDSYLPDPPENLVVTNITAAAHGTATIAPGGAGIIYTPTTGYIGPDSITYIMSDGHGGTATATVDITVRLNTPPTAGDDSITVDENSVAFVLNVLANDSTAPDPDETLTIQSVTVPNAGGTVTIAPGGQSLIYTPVHGSETPETFSYTINDGFGLTATGTVTITIRPNQPPAAIDDAYNLDENSTGNILNVLANDSDSDGTIVASTVQIVTPPTSGMATVNPNGTITYNAASGFAGNATFTYRVADDDGDYSAPATVTLRVRNPPTANPDAYSVLEKHTLNVAAPGVLANDVGFGSLTASVATQPSHGILTFSANGSFTYVPDITYVGIDTFTYTVNDGFRTSAPTTVTITVQDIPFSGTAGANVNVSKLAGNTFEPELVMNPNNPLQLFVVGLSENTGGGLFAAYSTDGGNNWTRTDATNGLIAEPGNPEGMPVAIRDVDVTWDNLGNLMLAYPTPTLGEFAVVVSNDGGASFTTGFTQPITPAQAIGDMQISYSPGRLWVAFTFGADNQITMDAPITGTGANGIGNFLLVGGAVTSTNMLDLAVNQVAPGASVYSFQTPANTQGPSTLGIGNDPDGTGGGAGALIPLAVINTGGRDLIPAQAEFGITAGGALAYDASTGAHRGRVYMAFAAEVGSETGDMDIFLTFSDDNGDTWSTPVRVNDVPAGAQFLPRVAVDPTNGQVAVTWLDTRNSGAANNTTDVYAAVSLDFGATFLEAIKVSEGSSGESFAEPAQGGFTDQDYGEHMGIAYRNGVLHVAWSDNSNSTADNPDGATRFEIYTAKVTVNTTGDVNFGRGAPAGFHNPAAKFDVNFDGVVSMRDVADLARSLRFDGTRSIAGQTRGPSDAPRYWDVNNDGMVSIADLAALATFLRFGANGGEGEDGDFEMLPAGGNGEGGPISMTHRASLAYNSAPKHVERSGNAALGRPYGIYPPGWANTPSLHDAIFASDDDNIWKR